ncbi:restriction endonuclease subunit S [Trichloromonas sp.]|uniref:restriction endonuclease subunit S n=1 Tax=Trichloromonas sp. TaxID=3069249 RepID=UPI002A4B0803|nr:restriction endonuclease subunit S [Trichloromonas sp.]
MSIPRYEKYKDSGVEWLGELPEGWEVGKFRHHFSESPEKIDNIVVGEMLSVSGYRGIEVKQYDDENQKRSDEDLVGYRIVRPGQLVVNTMWLNYAGLGVSAFEGHVSPAYRSYRITSDLDKRYVHHLMRSGLYVKGYTKFLTGIRPNSLQMSRDDLMSFPIVIPPLPEQRTIAAFLDHETGKIDALVAEQEKLIGLLKEKRQAVISHAVTKGLDPNARMKDSGVEWLGEVPEEWTVASLKHGYSIIGGSTPKSDSDTFWDGDIVWVTPADLSKLPGLEVADSARKITQAGLDSCGTSLVPSGSVILSTRAPIGTLGIAAKSLCTNQGCKALVPQGGQNSRYCVYLLLVSTGELNILGRGTTFLELSGDALGKFPFPIPPLPEQRTIAAFLDHETGKIDALIEEAQHAIELMKERRTAMISAAVTGKIDVRGYCPA